MTMIVSGSNGLTFPDNSVQALGSYTGFKNRLINGQMQIDQRNAGASVNLVSSGNTFIVDRFFGYAAQNSKLTAQQNAGSVTPPTGYVNYLGITSSATYTAGSSENFVMGQLFEGLNVADFGWGAAGASTVTLSFWVRSSLTGTFSGSLSNGAVDRSYVFSYTVNAANTWEQKSITIAGDTTGTWLKTNGLGIRLYFDLGCGSSGRTTAGSWNSGFYLGATGSNSLGSASGATFYITGVQLEKGSTATSFDYRPYGTELALCQRYYQQYTQPALRGVVTAGTTLGRVGMTMPVTMRTAPTATVGALPVFDGTAVGTVTGITTTYSTVSIVEFDLTTTNAPFTLGRPAIIYQAGSTTLTLSAEL